jgi:hypothetical protein
MSASLINDRFLLQISVVGYEFPDVVTDMDDANWLLIRLALQSQHGGWRWQVEDAGALTWELEQCVEWLFKLSAGEAVEQDYCGFSEPDIAFEVIRNDEQAAVGLSVHLMDEFQPPTKVLVPRENNIVTLRFHTPSDTLQKFAQDLMTELQAFPVRGARSQQS